MKKLIICLELLFLTGMLSAQAPKFIRLLPPNTDRGISVMKALSLRSSTTDWDTAGLILQDLSDLAWSANGMNRRETGKRTAPSALNAQDIDLYILLKSGIYIYDAAEHLLNLVAEGDFRDLAAGSQPEAAQAPVICLMVSDISRFNAGEEDQRLEWAAIDAGTVSQNIALFCASEGFATRPRVTMDKGNLRKILKLKDSQYLILNNPVSYNKVTDN
ncbi:MAG: SagB/ThcOx family dehydrogenase [Cyclobacteriaceae bacterium]|nr:SagB/ThcOx family dehydrogenase [Cyclobacteriaceae bacterium]